MQEIFLHYLFEHQLLLNTEFETLSPGQKNKDAGPDFFNSKIKIEDTIWVGNVEIHIRASDWKRHGHHTDKAYDNIILHLVLINDAEIQSTTGRIIPSVEVKFDQRIFETYSNLMNNQLWVHCENDLQQVDDLTKNTYIDALAVERLHHKSQFFTQLIQFNKNDWEYSFFQAIAKGFGSKVNHIPFELLAKSIKLNTLLKHKDNLQEVEALIFGQAGFLNPELVQSTEEDPDDYFQALQKDYDYLKQKYQLDSIRNELWKFSKIRPYNFPSLKLALFAQLISAQDSLFSRVVKCHSIVELNAIFELKASAYWNTHYRFNKPSHHLIKKLGKSSIQHLIINTIIPFLYVYAEKTGQEVIKEKAIQWFTDLEPEDNNITRGWEERGFTNENAMQSQGLIELKNEKCDKHQCIDCRIAHKILTLSWNESKQ